MGDVTCTIRAFIERSYSYFVPDFFTNPNPSRLTPGKKLVFIQTQGQPNEKLFADIFPRTEPFLKRSRVSGMPFHPGLRGSQTRRGRRTAKRR